MFARVQVPARKSENSCPQRGLIYKIILTSLVCVQWHLYLERHQSATDFDPEGVCGRRIFAPPFTSAHLQRRSSVELGSNMYFAYTATRVFVWDFIRR